MRVALDATPLLDPSGGIARYTAELAAALREEFPEDQLHLVSDQVGKRPSNWVLRRWWLVGLPVELRRLGAEVFHGTDFAVPYLRICPSVLTFHDCSPWRSGEERQTASERVRRRAPWALRATTMVVTPTEAVRREVLERFGLGAERVVAVPLAASGVFRPRPAGETAAALERLGARAPYILFVGTRERRKNLGRLVAAWKEARQVRPELGLIVVGRPGAEQETWRQEAGLTLAGRLEDEQVAALLSGAEAFVYPSLYEGFGLPVLEAMQAGAPVILSRDAALQEVAGGAAVAVDAQSPAELARAIVELTGDPARRREWRERGWARAAEFSWRQTAIRTREVYVEAVRRF